MATLNHLHKFFQLVEAEPEVGHGGFEQLPQFVVVHELHQHAERLLLRHLVAIMMLYSHKKADVVNIQAISHILSFLLFFQHSSSFDHASQLEGHKPMVLANCNKNLVYSFTYSSQAPSVS